MDWPRQAPLVRSEDGSGLVLHDAQTGSMYRLNGVAQQIWELCDGAHSPAALAQVLAARFALPPAAAARDVGSALAQFRDAGLIVTDGPSARERHLLQWALGAASATQDVAVPDVAEVNWDALVRLATDHGALALLHRAVVDRWSEQVPAVVRDRLERQQSANAMAAKALCDELLELLRELAAHDVRAFPLRGPVLAQALYGSPDLRQAGDLDIFVAPRDVARTREVLERRGYEFQAGRRTDALAIRKTAAVSICVDLQWALARDVFRFPVALDEVWSRLIPVEMAGEPVPQPEHGDHLLILCAHGSKHCWNSLIWIADIAAFLRVYGAAIDWDRLLTRAAGTGGLHQLLLGLRLAHDMIGAELPAPVRTALDRRSALDPLVAEARHALFAPAAERTFQGSLGLLRGGLFYLRTRERMRDRLPYAVHLLRESFRALAEVARPNQHDYAVVELPASLRFLYVGIRMMRVTMKWSRYSALIALTAAGRSVTSSSRHGTA